MCQEEPYSDEERAAALAKTLNTWVEGRAVIGKGAAPKRLRRAYQELAFKPVPAEAATDACSRWAISIELTSWGNNRPLGEIQLSAKPGNHRLRVHCLFPATGQELTLMTNDAEIYAQVLMLLLSNLSRYNWSEN